MYTTLIQYLESIRRRRLNNNYENDRNNSNFDVIRDVITNIDDSDNDLDNNNDDININHAIVNNEIDNIVNIVNDINNINTGNDNDNNNDINNNNMNPIIDDNINNIIVIDDTMNDNNDNTAINDNDNTNNGNNNHENNPINVINQVNNGENYVHIATATMNNNNENEGNNNAIARYQGICSYNKNEIYYTQKLKYAVVFQHMVYHIATNSSSKYSQLRLRCPTCNSKHRHCATCDAPLDTDDSSYYNNVRNFKFRFPEAPHDSSKCVSDETKIINDKGT